MPVYPDTDDQTPDYTKIRDDLLDVTRVLGLGVSIDPFTSPEKARDQIPMLAGVAAGCLDLGIMALLEPDDHDAIRGWFAGYRYAVTQNPDDTVEGTYQCLGVIAARLHLMWALNLSLSHHDPHITTVARLLKVASQLSGLASDRLDTDYDAPRLDVEGAHRATRNLLAMALDAIDATEAAMRSEGVDIDTRK